MKNHKTKSTQAVTRSLICMYSTFAPQLCSTAVMNRTMLKMSQGQAGIFTVGNCVVSYVKAG